MKVAPPGMAFAGSSLGVVAAAGDGNGAIRPVTGLSGRTSFRFFVEAILNARMSSDGRKLTQLSDLAWCRRHRTRRKRKKRFG